MKKLHDYHIIDRARDFLRCWILPPRTQTSPVGRWPAWKSNWKPPQSVRAAETRLSALRLERRKAERELARLLVSLGYAVQGEPAHGGDFPFHTALGYVPTSKRQPGRSRKKRKP